MHKRNCGRMIQERPIIFCLGSHRQSRTQLCPDDCLELYKPVCGSDGQVYLNECFLRKENCDNGIEKVDMSECAVASKCPSFCIPIYDPVCGSNKKIYLNRCQMLKENCNSTKIKNMPLQFCVGEDDVHKI
ncbi:Cleavage and polyadenylation specificity factor [Sarcoptes scabiei]|nr:Cleavage and polyadenylation specificity factor [Sarcoptes scabiei]